MKSFFSFRYLFLVILFYSCSPSKIKVDFIVKNGKIYTVDSLFTISQAFAVKDGKIISIGTNIEILNGFDANKIVDAEGKFVYPGFIDAHCHFYNYGLGLQEVNLIGTKSFDEVLNKLNEFGNHHPKKSDRSREDWIIGRGWDQNDWEIKQFPDRKKLDELFPDRPVLLKRIDGHAALANSYALKLAGVNSSIKILGGSIENNIDKSDTVDWNRNLLSKENQKMKIPFWSPTGILIDNAVEIVERIVPDYSLKEKSNALLNAQQDCFRFGLTTIDDAGLQKQTIELIDSLQKAERLKMRVYAMLSSSESNFDYYLKKGKYKTDQLNVCSFKFYADGALGSRGACMKNDYSDKHDWKGFLLQQEIFFRKYAKLIFKAGFQMNTHCIGDSSDKIIASIYREALQSAGNKNDLLKKYRWRIEHAQVVSKEDLNFFKDIIPSVQPTHATSDMYWAEDRLGSERICESYAYKSLMSQSGMLALGTDFPVEEISPFKTFYAAVFRKDAKGYPKGGFQMQEALSRQDAIKGMTIWAAFSNFEEKEKGSIEKGKFADFIIVDTDLMNCAEKDILNAKALKTFVNGEQVYSAAK
ncbi:MAG: amidohydrolase [Bacteroidota bacterium]